MKIAEDAIGATVHATVTCYRCTKQETLAGCSDAEVVLKAHDAGWRDAGDKLTCRKCSK